MSLVAEPKNPADANAIAVFSSRDIQIGYVVADRTSIIHRAWGDAREARAIFQEPNTGGAATRVAFDRDPTPPPPSKKPALERILFSLDHSRRS